MKSAKYLVFVLALVGCATKQEFAFQATRPNLDFDKDKYECLERAQALRNADLYYSCMGARGWKKVPKSQSQETASSTVVQSKNASPDYATWVLYATRDSEQVQYFYDPGSIWRNGNTVKVSDIGRYAAMQSILDGKAYYNLVKSRHEINCKTRQDTLESMMFIKETQSSLDIVLDAGGDRKPRTVSKKSVLNYLVDAVCE